MRLASYLVVLLIALTSTGCDHLASRPDIVLVTVDALRADHLGAYGYARATSPRIDRLAAEGILFENAYAQASYTVPSVTAILTGNLPLYAGVKNEPVPFASKNESVAEALTGAGYDTAAFVDNGLLRWSAGWNQGFRTFRCVDRDDASELTDAALAWLNEERDRPFFLWVHYLDPHAPYKERRLYRESFREPADARTWIGAAEADDESVVWDAATARNAVNLYDGEIRYTDDHLGRLLDRLDRRERADRTVLILSADHGEAFLEHGDKSHGFTVYEETVRVPLIFRVPQARNVGLGTPRREDALVGLIDLFPTIVDYARVRPRKVQGQSLRPLLENREGWTERPVLMQAAHGDFGIRDRGGKLVYRGGDAGDGAYVWYDLAADPGERNPMWMHRVPLDRSERLRRLASALDAYRWQWSKSRIGQVRKVDPQTKAALRALGYVRD